jgi:hypothetical protein
VPFDDQQPVGAFAAGGTHPALRVRVGPGRLRWGADHLHVGRGEDRVEPGGELRVPIADQEPAGRSKKFVRTARSYRTIEIQAGSHTITAADPLPDELNHAIKTIHAPAAAHQLDLTRVHTPRSRAGRNGLQHLAGGVMREAVAPVVARSACCTHAVPGRCGQGAGPTADLPIFRVRAFRLTGGAWRARRAVAAGQRPAALSPGLVPNRPLATQV